jgi:hypothetical protein
MNNIIKTSCNIDFTKESLLVIEQEFTNEFMGMILQRAVTKNLKLLDMTELSPIKEYILKCMPGYELIGSWASKIDPGVGAGEHTHPDADVSGTFCLSTNQGIIYHHVNDIIRQEILYPNDLIVWSSDIVHSVPLNENKNPWYSINFDLRKV